MSLSESPAPAKTTPYRGVKKPPVKEEEEKASELKVESQASGIKPKPSPYRRPSDKSQDKPAPAPVEEPESKPKPTPYKPYRKSGTKEGSPQQTVSEITPTQSSKPDSKPPTPSRSFIQRRPAGGQEENQDSKTPPKNERTGGKAQTKSEIYQPPNRLSKVSEPANEAVLKKSAVAGFVMKRLVRNQLWGALNHIRANCANARVHASSEATILLEASVRIVRLKENSLTSGAF